MASKVEDHNKGKYTITFTPSVAGKHKLDITIFGRHIRESPFLFDVTEHNNPVQKIGGRGSGNNQFIQPLAVVIGNNQNAFVLDTGNSRIKVLDSDLNFLKHIGSHGLEHHSSTGMALSPVTGNLVVINWRTKEVTEMDYEGLVVKKFTSDRFIEPISIGVNSHGEVIIADNGLSKLVMFDSEGNFLREIGSKGGEPGEFKLITSLYVAPNDNILVTDNRLQIFSRVGKFIREITTGTEGKGTFGGVTIDRKGSILATRQEKGKCFVAYFNSNMGGDLKFILDSEEDKLKRASGLATLPNGHVLVVDLGNDAIKKFRYI